MVVVKFQFHSLIKIIKFKFLKAGISLVFIVCCVSVVLGCSVAPVFQTQ
jgi:hypothetical protein